MSKAKSSQEDSLRWLLSFYRSSEINGALFFGRLAQYVKQPEIRHDLTKHFADESMHAWYWTKCIQDLDLESLPNSGTYQDKYFEEIGIPANIMEILAITQIFEKRVINQYKKHLDSKENSPYTTATLKQIMADEGWHLVWVNKALKELRSEYGADLVEETLARYQTIDNEIYGDFVHEHEDRLIDIFALDATSFLQAEEQDTNTLKEET